jgi:uncharacterized C2H2 Zn-finger protein
MQLQLLSAVVAAAERARSHGQRQSSTAAGRQVSVGIASQYDHAINSRSRYAFRLFTCDVCGMQFRYLKSFKKHRLNHALERLHGKKEVNENTGELMVSSTNEEMRGVISLEDEQMLLDEQDQDDTIDSISNTNSNMNFSSSSSSLHLINKQMGDPHTDNNDNSGGDIKDKSICSAITECDKQETNGNITSSERHAAVGDDVHEAESSSGFSLSQFPQGSFPMQGSSNSLKALLSGADALSNPGLMGLNSQEVSVLNFLRVENNEKRDKRFACPFCGKCVRSKENLKLHVRKHTGMSAAVSICDAWLTFCFLCTQVNVLLFASFVDVPLAARAT